MFVSKFTAEICSTVTVTAQNWHCSLFGHQWFRARLHWMSPHQTRNLKVKPCFITYFSTTACSRYWNQTFNNPAGMKQQESDLSPQSCDVFGQQVSHKILWKTQNCCHTDQKWICQDRRQFLQSVQWRTKYLLNKYESSFSNDAAHKTSKWNDRSSLLTPPLEERKYSNAGLATPAYPKGDKLKNKGYLNGSSSYNKAHI